MGIQIRSIFSPGSYYKSKESITVDVNSEHSLDTWSNALGLTRKELLAAIRKYGANVKDIRQGLKQANENSS